MVSLHYEIASLHKVESPWTVCFRRVHSLFYQLIKLLHHKAKLTTWSETTLPRAQTSLSRALRKAGRRHRATVPFPWSLAAHHQSLASTLRKTKRMRRRLEMTIKLWYAPVKVVTKQSNKMKKIFHHKSAYLFLNKKDWLFSGFHVE